MRRRSIFIVCTAVCLYSCEKVVNLNLHNAPPVTVIEGEVTDQAGPYTVKVRKSVNFSADNVYPAVSGAAVRISDNEGASYDLTELSPGQYSTQTLVGKPGNTYTLNVNIHDTLYTAVSTMPYPVPFDSLTFRTTSAFGDDNISAVPNFQDPPGVKNYYQFIEYINGKQFTKYSWVFDDRLSEGRYMTRGLRSDSTYLAVGDSLEVRMYCIDVNIYNYFNQLTESQGGGAFNTTASPANPVSNISGGALGYFSAHTVRSARNKVY